MTLQRIPYNFWNVRSDAFARQACYCSLIYIIKAKQIGAERMSSSYGVFDAGGVKKSVHIEVCRYLQDFEIIANNQGMAMGFQWGGHLPLHGG